MFIAQLDEVDVVDKMGQQQEDINSLVQFLANTFHIKHKPVKDSDDDNARYFHASKFEDYNFSQLGLIKKEHLNEVRTVFPIYSERLINFISLDILAPPPKA